MGYSAAELTAMQERGSAWIMRRAIKDNKRYTKVDSISKDPRYKELKKLYPVIDKSWINTFFLQQKKMLDEFSQTKFKEFNRDEGFMAFITNLIREKFGISQKDNWNPADIWLIENSNKVEQLIEKHLSGKAQTIIELNLLMQKLYKERKVVGISLKKISGKVARYEEVNISRLTPRFKKDMYNFDITQIKMALDIARKKFSSQDTRIFLTGKGSDTVYNFQIKGNTSSTYANLKWEPTMKGAAAARLGKAPVAMVMDLLESHRFDYVNDHYQYPRTKPEFQKEEKKWLTLFKKISKKVDTGIIEKDFIKNLTAVFGTREKHIASSKLMQLKFLSELLKLTKDAQNELMTDIAFIAQKKGKAFGPFGKLY